MEIQDQGHRFKLDSYDGECVQTLTFMKREGPGYPFNVGHYAGTNCQEVIRALISRLQYLSLQIPCWQNRVSVWLLRATLWLFERRAANRHGRRFAFHLLFSEIESEPTCPTCGHVRCWAH